MSYAAVLEQQTAQEIAAAEVWTFTLPFPFGQWVVTASLKGLRSIDWVAASSELTLKSNDLPPNLAQWQKTLAGYLNDGADAAIHRIPIDWEAISGTDFQKRCWLALMTIPFGETRSYGWVAEQVGSPSAVRAVGGANRKNPLPLVIPCHRVIASNGALTGYMGTRGLEIKQWLLNLERASA